ncbi:MAG: InlB B-repeat-containing protein, partial [Clostridia bacterium]|nr:InlB B-repeat-containing protein [Clostridia bacterium]
MKKLLKRLTKKSFALFMTVVMLLSCWVWFAPVPEAQAANGSNLTAEQLTEIESFFSVSANDAVVKETYGKYFANDGNSYTSDANLNSIYNNVLYSGNAAEAVKIGAQNIRSGRGELSSTIFYYPATVLFYDGVTTPQFGVSMVLDGGTDAYIQHYGTSISGTGLALGKWRGYEDNTVDRWNNPVIFLDVYSGSNSATTSGDNSSTTNTVYHQGTSGAWTTYANVIQVTSAPSDYYTSVSPKFTTHVGVPAYDDDCDDNDLAAANKTYTTGNATTIYIINTVTWGQALYDACMYYFNNYDSTKDYTNLEAYKTIVQNLFAANPNKITNWSNPATACDTYKTNAKSAVDAWNTFKNAGGLQEKKYTVTWNNEDGSWLETDTVTKGTKPVYNGSNPTKEQTVSETYTFDGWRDQKGNKLDANTTISEDTVYTAEFKASTRYYTVRYMVNGSVYSEKNDYTYGATLATAPRDPEIAGKVFIGWKGIPEDRKVYQSFDITAEFADVITVTFKDGDTETSYQ